MFITKKSLHRRTLLRGAGAALGLPLLEAMVPALTASAKTPANPIRRFGAVYVPHGKIYDQWTPATAGRQFEFTPILKPLMPFRDSLCVVSGLDGPADVVGGGHATAPAMWLTGVTPKKTEGVDLWNATTIDQLIARKIGQTTLLPSLEIATEDFTGFIGACDIGFSCAYMNTISWQSPSQPLPMEINPRIVFERMFGGTGAPSERLERIRTRRSLLDSISGSAARLRGNLGPGDRVRMEQYLEDIRETERRIQRQIDAAGVEARNKLALPEAPAGIPHRFEEHVALMFELLAIAYQADITRVATFMMARDLHNRTYPQIGINEPHHALSHHQDKPDKIARFAKVNTYHVSLFAKFLERLRAAPDGEGSVLDHSVILYGSGMGNPNIHSHEALPQLIAGGGAGKIRGGRHLAARAHDPNGNLLLSIVQAFDVSVEKIGYSTGTLDL